MVEYAGPKFRVVVYRRTGVQMQTFNANTIGAAMAVHQANAGLRGVYKIELLVCIDTWEFATDGRWL